MENNTFKMVNKIRKTIVILIVFITVFILHLLYFKFKLPKETCGGPFWFQEYIKGQEYFLGISYALSFTFIAVAFFKFKENRKNSLKVAMGGGLLAIILWFFCFLFGCCGSPMLILYLNLVGISSLKIPKFALLLTTIIFISIGYIWLIKKTSDICCGGKPCEKDKSEEI